MEEMKHSCLVVDRLEYYITKEIEKAIYGDGDKCYTALYQRLIECINARKELNYEPIPKNVEELLDDYGYDEDFIKEFVQKAKKHDEKGCSEF
ncbi:hypothetical protein [Clostridium sp. YIM B02551]|uniref:hypothetical protein n=1 Tax=Clostridium sp. YIM B02551 TaxID=2910679 RepID=UPI001EEB4DF4|nr:hypothetical protein [Clostridium sp. YIM B02551]